MNTEVISSNNTTTPKAGTRKSASSATTKRNMSQTNDSNDGRQPPPPQNIVVVVQNKFPFFIVVTIVGILLGMELRGGISLPTMRLQEDLPFHLYHANDAQMIRRSEEKRQQQQQQRQQQQLQPHNVMSSKPPKSTTKHYNNDELTMKSQVSIKEDEKTPSESLIKDIGSDEKYIKQAISTDEEDDKVLSSESKVETTVQVVENTEILIIDDDDYDVNNFDNPASPLYGNHNKNKKDVVIRLPPPKVGKHRPEADALFSFARGLQASAMVRFVNSLLATGFDGDIVLGLSGIVWDDDEYQEDTELTTPEKREENFFLREYLKYHAEHSHLVVHDVVLECVRGRFCKTPFLFYNKTSEEYLPDPRKNRDVAQLRFEYYWAWSLFYGRSSRIFLSDARDVHFQRNPFPPKDVNMERTIHAFLEDNRRKIQRQMVNAGWIRIPRGKEVLKSIGHLLIICSGTTLGGKVAMVRKQIM
jgi:hypothetical protein